MNTIKLGYIIIPLALALSLSLKIYLKNKLKTIDGLGGTIKKSAAQEKIICLK